MGVGSERETERLSRLAELRKQGWTLNELGAEFGVSYTRIRQLLIKHYPEITAEVAKAERNRRLAEWLRGKG